MPSIVLRLFGLALALLATGCASRNIDPAYQLDPAGTSGLLVGSITYEGPISGYRVYYRMAGSESGAFVEAGAGSVFEPGFHAKQDLETLGLMGKLFAVKLPPGEYEIYGWAVVSGAAQLSPTQAFSLRYTVRPGRAAYAGNFNFRQTGSLGLTVTAVRVDFSQPLARDAALLAGKHPTLSVASIDREARNASTTSLGGSSGLKATIYAPL